MSTDEILPIPDIPEQIVQAVNTETLAVFVGAGVSRLIGCYGWSDLAEALISRCFKEKKADGSTLISYKEKDFLSKENPKKVITICKGILEQNKLTDAYVEILKKAFRDGEKIDEPNIYDEIYKLRGLRLTTNADQHFDRLFRADQILHNHRKFPISDPSHNHLYHIHGSILDPSSLVFTVPDYLKRYSDDRFTKFLRFIFSKYTVLFIGYGLEEFEILDFLISKSGASMNGKEIRHYILMGLFKGDENILAHENHYFRGMNVQVKAFQKDIRGYDQLIEVLRDWNVKIDRLSSFIATSFEEIESVAANFKLDNAKEVLQLIRNDAPQREKLFRVLTDAPNPEKWFNLLSDDGYFEASKNPQPVESKDNKGYYSIPAWEILGYLENLSKANATSPNARVTAALKRTIKEISEYRLSDGKRVENYRTDWFIFKLIFNLPDDQVQKKHIDYIREFLGTQWRSTLINADLGKVAFPKLIQAQNEKLALELLRATLQFKKVKKSIGNEFESVVEGYWLDECLTQHVEGLTRLAGINSISVALDVMKQLLKQDKNQFNNIWIPTVDGTQEKFGDRLDVILVEFVRRSIEHSTPKDLNGTILKLLNSKQVIFNRLALHAIRMHYKDLKVIFWRWAKTNLLKNVSLKHEIYQLIKSNSLQFTKPEVKKVLRWIEEIDAYREGLTPDQQKKVLAYRRKEWLTALLDLKVEKIHALYKKYDQINSAEVDHPGHTSWTEARWRSNKSPIDMPSLMAKSVTEIVSFINNFQPDPNTWDMPNKEGMADTLQEAVKNDPQKFSAHLDEFLSCDTQYCYSIVKGYAEAWKEKRDFSWLAVFEFVSNFFKQDEIWAKDFPNGYNYRDWIVAATADLIRDGTREDSHAFDPELISQAEDILVNLIARSKSNLTGSNDVITGVLNSTFGRLFQSLVNLSLRYARLNPKPIENRWRPKIKTEFTRLASDAQKPIEFSVIVGEYLRNLMYLDAKWVEDNFTILFPKADQEHWEAAFAGYLFYANQLQKDLYMRFRDAGHYEKAIVTKFKSKDLSERMVQHICIGFNEDFEKLSDKNSLISKLIATEDPDLLYQVVRFYQMIRSQLKPKLELKLREIWKVVFAIAIKHAANPGFQKIMSQMSGFIGLVKDLDAEAVGLAKGALKYIEKEYNLLHVAENLLKHADESPKEVGEIFLALIQEDLFPTYEETKILTIIEKLYKANLRAVADQICNGYLAKNIEFVRPIYLKNQIKEVSS